MQNLKQFILNHKKLITIFLILLFIIMVIIITVLVLKVVNKSDNISISANSLKSQAIDSLNNKDNTRAKELFIQAKQKYEVANDTNNIVDVSAQIWLIDHSNN